MSLINADVLFGWSLKLLLLEDLGVLYGNVTVADEPGFLRDDTADQGEQSGAEVHISDNHSCVGIFALCVVLRPHQFPVFLPLVELLGQHRDVSGGRVPVVMYVILLCDGYQEYGIGIISPT